VDDPKSEAGSRTVALTADTAALLWAWRKQQLRERLAWGEAWTDSGLAAGVDIKVVREMLGHSTSASTRDVYTSVVPEIDTAAAAGAYGVRRCRSRGNSVTSRMFSARVSRLVQRSSPIANPPCGGIPCAKASR
jgi:hypothetical protein